MSVYFVWTSTWMTNLDFVRLVVGLRPKENSHVLVSELYILMFTMDRSTEPECSAPILAAHTWRVGTGPNHTGLAGGT
jgi:hypothetical protein